MITVARLALTEMFRRRASLVLLVSLPFAFYLARHDLPGQSTRLMTLGLGWTVSTLALFTAVGALGVERRLRVAGFGVVQLLGGRWLAVTALGVLLAAVDWVVVLLDQDIERSWAIGLMLLLAVLVGAPLGTLVGALLRRELEGALALLVVLSVQVLADPESTLARAMPFWSLRQLGTYAVDGADGSYLTSALAHAALVWAVLTAAMVAVTARRLRLHRLPTPGTGTRAGAGGNGVAHIGE